MSIPSVLVCGGRGYADRVRMDEALRLYVPSVAYVLNGGADGADALAREWAVANERRVWTVHADWKRHGKAAGPMRNQQMIEHEPILVIAFPGGKGTKDMVRRSKAAGIPVIEVMEQEPRRP